MFCGCPVVDPTETSPNVAVCPVCSGMPGALPVLNSRAVEFGVKVALALGCQVNQRSIFARKNYFYPDLPKGYQISQYEEPLARNGIVRIHTAKGTEQIRVRRVHLEEDTGKLTHKDDATLLDLNRAGVPLLEIVSEPEIHSAEAARVYAEAIREILIYLDVNSGDMQKGVMRVEPNVSLQKRGEVTLGTRTEIKNLNSFRALERGIKYEITRQTKILQEGGVINQQTVGWDEQRQVTFTQRFKEREQDYRYFPEPDLPPLILDREWIQEIRGNLPELPQEKRERFQHQYDLNAYDSNQLASEPALADYFEAVIEVTTAAPPKMVANWITGEVFNLLNQTGEGIETQKISPLHLGKLLDLIQKRVINPSIGKSVLEMTFHTGENPETIVINRGLQQISDMGAIDSMIRNVLEDHPDEVKAYLSGKEGLLNWFFGQVMRNTGGKANPDQVRDALNHQLAKLGKEWNLTDHKQDDLT